MLDIRGVLDGVRRDISDYTLNKVELFRPRAITPLLLPSGKTLTLPSPAGGALGLANSNIMRLWPFFIDQSGPNLAGVAISPQFSGPGLIASVALYFEGGGGSPHPTFQIYYSADSGGGGSNIASATEPGGSRAWEAISTAVAAAFPVEAGAGPLTEINASIQGFNDKPLGKYVPLPTFFLKVRLVAAAAGVARANGWVRVIENYDPFLAGGF